MIALYYRLSGADGDLGKDGKDESNSIENQRALIADFLESRDELKAKETAEFIDDGYTGSNFRRPGFESMIEGVKKGSVDTIIVKDLSRFGRDYIGVGEYLEQIFPLFDIRFIAINDRFDSENYKGSTAGIEMVVSNLVNSMYSRDAGRKLYSANRIKWQRGCSTSGTVPFGYIRDKNGRYAINPTAAKTVRRIFDLALEGKNTRQIADVLNEEGHLIPSTYNRLNGVRSGGGCLKLNPDEIWDGQKVWRILRNETYTGAMILGRLHKVSGRQRLAPRDKWFITPGVNEAIVTEEEFQAAQDVIKTVRKKTGFGVNRFPLKGKIRCGHCRCTMDFNFITYEKKVWCGTGRESKYSKCSDEIYSLSQIEGSVFYSLRHYLESVERLGLWLKEEKKSVEKAKRQAGKSVEQDRVTIEILTAEKMRSYENYVNGEISRDGFMAEKRRLDGKIATLKERIEKIEDNVPEPTAVDGEVETVIEENGRIGNMDKLTQEMADAFIENVYIHAGGRMEIVFKGQDKVTQMCERLLGESVEITEGRARVIKPEE